MKQLERDASTSEPMKRVNRVFSLGIDYSNHFCRDLIRYSMMVGDDDVDPETFGMTDRLDISGSTVHGDHEGDSFCLELIEKI